MFQSSRSVAHVLAGMAYLFSAVQIHALSTAYVTLCCNAPSTVGVFNPTTLDHARTIVIGSGGDGIALSPDGTKMFVTSDHKNELEVISNRHWHNFG